MLSTRREVNGLHVRIDGEGEPVVFVNGLFQTTDSWQGYVPDLSRYFQVVRWDQRNQGQSPSAETIVLEEHVRDLASIVDELGAERVGLVGHSFGCRLALEYAAHHQERVTGVVLVSSNSPSLAARYNLLFRGWLRTLTECGPDIAPFVDQLVPWIYSTRFSVEHGGLIRLVYRQFAERARDPLKANLRAAVDAYDVAKRGSWATNLDVPVRVLQGDHDYITPPSELRPLMATLNKGDLRVLPGGHALAMEAAPAVIHSLVEQFA